MSWNDMMRRLVVGKKRDKAFSAADLPKNRRQVFKFVYKNRALELFNAGFLCLVLCLPLVAWQLWGYLSEMALIEKYSGALQTVDFFNANLEAITIKNLINIPCMMVASIGLAGIVYVVRKLCWDEPISLFKDFGKGIKNSWLQYLIISFVLAIYVYLNDVIFNYLRYFPDQNGSISIALMVLMGLFDLTLLSVNCYAFGLASLYDMNILQIYRAAFIITFKKLFTNILMVIAGILPVALCFIIPHIIAYLIGIVIVVFGGIGFTTLVVSLFMYRQFDEFINKNSYPEMVNKGIYTGEEIEDELDEVTADEIEKLAEQLASEYDEESQE